MLNEQTLDQIVGASPVRTVGAGKTLFSKGDPAEAVYVVIEGEVAIEIISPNGRIVHVATLRPGAVFGEIAVLDKGVRTADVRALSSALVLRISDTAFRELVENSPAFSRAIIDDLIEKLRNTDGQLEDISFKPLHARLASLLLDFVADAPETVPSIKITQAALAERLSATREKVNVHLQSIQRAGAIKLRRGRIEVLDVGRLTTFVDRAE